MKSSTLIPRLKLDQVIPKNRNVNDEKIVVEKGIRSRDEKVDGISGRRISELRKYIGPLKYSAVLALPKILMSKKRPRRNSGIAQ
jgi:hypothetical protein